MYKPEFHGRQPSLLHELFDGFTDIAAKRGVVKYGPLDPSLKPGNDGTLTPDGDQASGFEYVVPTEDLSQTIRGMGIDSIEISSFSSTVFDDAILDATTWVNIREQIGLKKSFALHQDPSGRVTANFYLDADMDNPAKQENLSDEEKEAIINDLFSGDSSWLRIEGPGGDFARAIHLCLTAPDEPDDSDMERLREVLTSLIEE